MTNKSYDKRPPRRFDLALRYKANGDYDVFEWHNNWILIPTLPGVH